MPYKGLPEFIDHLEKSGELLKITSFVNPLLEITEITDRVTKTGGPALLFEKTGTSFPLLINAFGSEQRMADALSRSNLNDPAKEIEDLFRHLTANQGTFAGKLAAIPALLNISKFIPSKRRGRGRCHEVIHTDPALDILPVLKCWPFDGGRFITLPIVNTYHPVTLKPNAGMYRMQILDKKTTAMHWQMHKTGAVHYEEWRKKGMKMPVSVVLGGDPVYTYAATAPLPENIDEYMLAGFLRNKKVKMVKCRTNDIYVPDDSDIVIEGFVDPSEEKVWEGPFGDHTGFYSLADWYPKFHVTCITHARDAVYPATIVGIPPMEDAFFALATEKIFLAPVKLTLQPEIADLHMPGPGVAHNLVVVRINKTYQGQGMKVLSSLMGAGQMMFTKYLAVVSGEVDIRNYNELLNHILENTDPLTDIVFSRGPLDVLDHSADQFAFGGKAGIDATEKTPAERTHSDVNKKIAVTDFIFELNSMVLDGLISAFSIPGMGKITRMAVVSVDMTTGRSNLDMIKNRIEQKGLGEQFRLILIVDHTVDVTDHFIVAWQILGNSDPVRDHNYLKGGCIIIDGTAKFSRKGGFPRHWPNIVCSDEKTVLDIDNKWNMLGIGPIISSPSQKYRILEKKGNEEVTQTF